MNKKITLIMLFFLAATIFVQPCFAKRVMIPATGKVNSFGTYSFNGKLNFDIKSPGEQEIGAITVEGTYNGEYPWIMRVYTDNTNYTGIAGSNIQQNPSGIVSTDGRFIIPLMINAPIMGEGNYRNIPDINQNNYTAYRPNKLNMAADYTDCVIMGVDPRNEFWVAAEDNTLLTNDDNTLGDMAQATPFVLKFKTKADERAPAANYTANLYIEIVTCP